MAPPPHASLLRRRRSGAGSRRRTAADLYESLGAKAAAAEDRALLELLRPAGARSGVFKLGAAEGGEML